MKENKIEKLILDLSNRWDCSPQEAVDRLNSMNESEINKLINSMTKKFDNGGYLSNGMPIGNRIMISKITESVPKRNYDELLKMAAQKAAEQQAQQLQRDTAGLKSQMFKTQMELMEKRTNSELNNKLHAPFKPTEAGSVGPKYYNGPRPKFANGGFINCLRNGGSVEKCKCGCDKIAKAQDGDKVLPQFAKIIEGGGPENKPRTIYYSQNRKDLSRFPNNIKDGDLISEEKLLNPGYWWRNELSKTGLWNRPVEAAEYAKPSYQRYVQHDNSGLNLQRAVEIDPIKAWEETTQKINKIRGNKFKCGGPLSKKRKRTS